MLEVLASPMICYQDPILEASCQNEVEGKGNLYEPLNKMASIRKRNAGATMKLANAKSMAARNKTIHEGVEFASFNDVESK